MAFSGACEEIMILVATKELAQLVVDLFADAVASKRACNNAGTTRCDLRLAGSPSVIAGLQYFPVAGTPWYPCCSTRPYCVSKLFCISLSQLMFFLWLLAWMFSHPAGVSCVNFSCSRDQHHGAILAVFVPACGGFILP